MGLYDTSNEKGETCLALVMYMCSLLLCAGKATRTVHKKLQRFERFSDVYTLFTPRMYICIFACHTMSYVYNYDGSSISQILSVNDFLSILFLLVQYLKYVAFCWNCSRRLGILPKAWS